MAVTDQFSHRPDITCPNLLHRFLIFTSEDKSCPIRSFSLRVTFQICELLVIGAAINTEIGQSAHIRVGAGFKYQGSQSSFGVCRYFRRFIVFPDN